MTVEEFASWCRQNQLEMAIACCVDGYAVIIRSAYRPPLIRYPFEVHVTDKTLSHALDKARQAVVSIDQKVSK